MSTQKRHQAGAPASQGGQFAVDPKPESDTSLIDPEQRFRDLGVTGRLRPYSQPRYYTPEGAMTLTSDSGREILVFIQDGRLRTKVEFPSCGDTNEYSDEMTEDVVAEAMHDAAVADHFSSLMEPKGRMYELREAYATVYSPNGALYTSVTAWDYHGYPFEISRYHDRDDIFIDRGSDRVEGDAAKELLAEIGEELLRDEQTWGEMFREAARRMVNDEDIKPFVREGAMRADDAAWAKIRA